MKLDIFLRNYSVSCITASLFTAILALPAYAGQNASQEAISPATCGPGDTPEPGIQGNVPAGDQAQYNCGVKLVGELPLVGRVQGLGACAYVRKDDKVHVIDVRNPREPKEVGAYPLLSGSETMRVVSNDERSILVSGSTVYDVSDCLKPVHAGEIQWPPLKVGSIQTRILPHDIRINHAATKVYASFGLWEADITNLQDPETWTVKDYRCALAPQQNGPWQEVHRIANEVGLNLCEDAVRSAPGGAGYSLGASPVQSSILWPMFAHSPDLNADDTLLFAADQAGRNSGKLTGGESKLRIVDLTQDPPKIVGETAGPGHGLDWFRTGGRDYVLLSNEIGQATPEEHGSTCHPYPRPNTLGWAFEAFIVDVTNPVNAHQISHVGIAINDPEHCKAREASGLDPSIAYHMIDNPFDATFAAVNFGSAGLRIFDIRKPKKPVEVAYFNHGPMVHAGIGYYDASRGLIYAAGGDGLKILELEPQVRAHLGL